MDVVNVRDLRNHGGEVLGRIAAGESLIVVRSGTAVAELRPLPRPGLTAMALISRRRNLPMVDPAALRHDIDEATDASL